MVKIFLFSFISFIIITCAFTQKNLKQPPGENISASEKIQSPPLKNKILLENSQKEKVIYEFTLEELEKKEKADRACKLGLELLKKGIEGEALVKIKEGLAIYEELKFKHGTIEIKTECALYFEAKKQFEKSLNFFKELLPVFQEMRDNSGLFFLYFYLGMLSDKLNDLENSLTYYQKALVLRDSVNATEEITDILNNLGVIYNKKTLYFEAVSYFERGIELSEAKKNYRKLCLMINNLANTYLNLNKFPEIYKFEDLLATNCTLLEEPEQLVNAFYLLAMINENRANLTAAIKYLEKEIEISEKNNFPNQLNEKKYLKYLKKKKELSSGN